MGLLDGVMGNASKIDAAKIQEEFSRILAPGEVVEHAYQLIRDYFVFTDKRLVLVDKQGMTGSKVEYHSLRTRASRTSASRPGARSIWMQSSRSGYPAQQRRFKSGSTRSSASIRCSRCWLATC